MDTEQTDVAALQKRVAELEYVLQLKDAQLQPVLRLSPIGNTILNLLLSLPIVSGRAITTATKSPSDPKILVHRLGKRLKLQGISIKCRRDLGWFLEDEDKIKLDTLKVT